MTYEPFQCLAYFTEDCIQMHLDNCSLPESETFFYQVQDLVTEAQDQLMALARLPAHVKEFLQQNGVYVPTAE